MSTSPVYTLETISACPGGIASWLSGPGWGQKDRAALPINTDLDFIVSANYSAGVTHGEGPAGLDAVGLHVGFRRASDGAYIQSAASYFTAQLWYDRYVGQMWRVQYAYVTDTWTITRIAQP
jgi:hypothetical protein